MTYGLWRYAVHEETDIRETAKHDPQVKVRIVNGSSKSAWTKTKHLKVTKKTTKETIETITVKKTKKGTKKTIKKTTKNKIKYSLKTANYTVK